MSTLTNLNEFYTALSYDIDELNKTIQIEKAHREELGARMQSQPTKINAVAYANYLTSIYYTLNIEAFYEDGVDFLIKLFTQHPTSMEDIYYNCLITMVDTILEGTEDFPLTFSFCDPKLARNYMSVMEYQPVVDIFKNINIQPKFGEASEVQSYYYEDEGEYNADLSTTQEVAKSITKLLTPEQILTANEITDLLVGNHTRLYQAKGKLRVIQGIHTNISKLDMTSTATTPKPYVRLYKSLFNDDFLSYGQKIVKSTYERIDHFDQAYCGIDTHLYRINDFDCKLEDNTNQQN